MCGKFYEDNPAGELLSLEELINSVSIIDRKITAREKALIRVLYECTLVQENRIPPRDLLVEARRIGEKYPRLTIQ